jgi:hypothetical protein
VGRAASPLSENRRSHRGYVVEGAMGGVQYGKCDGVERKERAAHER